METLVEFKPFTHTFICPDCNRPLMLYVQPVHLKETVNCPRCSRTLTAIIRREIKGRCKEGHCGRIE